MALVVANQSATAAVTPSAATYSYSFSCTADANAYLVIVVATASQSGTLNNATYNSVGMTRVGADFVLGTGSVTYSIWKLAGPASGPNTVQLTYSASQFNPLTVNAFSLTGCGGVGQSNNNNTATIALTVSANSIIAATSMNTGSTGTSMTIDGISESLTWNNVSLNSSYVYGGYSTNLGAGSRTSTSVGSSNIGIIAIEFLAAIIAANTAFAI